MKEWIEYYINDIILSNRGKTTVCGYLKLFPYIDNMHIKDALLNDGAVVPAGSGDSNMAVLLKKFSKADGKRFLSVEPHLSVF